MLEVREHKVPLREVDGVLCVGDTRVTLDCVVEMFDQGASAEEIAEEYDSIALPDVYAVLSYYLRNREEILEYLGRQSAESTTARAVADAAFPNPLRQKLLRAKRDVGDAVRGG